MECIIKRDSSVSPVGNESVKSVRVVDTTTWLNRRALYLEIFSIKENYRVRLVDIHALCSIHEGRLVLKLDLENTSSYREENNMEMTGYKKIIVDLRAEYF